MGQSALPPPQTAFMSAGIAQTDFSLTPYSGDQYQSAAQAVRRANILSLADGHGMIYTSAGHNLALQVPLARLAALSAAHSGTSFTAMPQVSGDTLVMPSADVFLDGEHFQLSGPELDGSQHFSLLGLSEGNYTLTLESWNALAGVTTYGRASLPSFTAGVVSPQNKPADDRLYLAGNLDAPQGPSDQPFITGTLETQRILQKQYRLRLIKDVNLEGSLAYSAAPADRAGTLYSGDGDVLKAVSPHSLSAYDVAVDRTFTLCKLALVRITSAGAEVLVNAPHLHRTASGAGQDPIPLIPTLRRFQGFTTCEFERVDLAHAVLADRVKHLEKLSDAGAFQATQQNIQAGAEQRIFFTSEVRDPLGWHDSTTVSHQFAMDFTGSVQVICHATFDAAGSAEGLDGNRGLALMINGAHTGVRVSQLALGGVRSDVQLAGEVDVRPGDRLEVAALHTSVNTALPLTGARLTIRRVR